jgi:hypothetical protein
LPAAHTFGLFDDPNAPAREEEAFNFIDKLAKPLHYGNLNPES